MEMKANSYYTIISLFVMYFMATCCGVCAEKETNIELKEGDAYMFRSGENNKGVKVIVAVVGGSLEVLFLEKNGLTPISIDSIQSGKYRITYSRNESKCMIFDLDGDGIPDRKIKDGKMYKVGKLVWEEIDRDERDEQLFP